MSYLDIANAYRDAQAIVMDARLDMQQVDVVLGKLRRIAHYLDAQAAAEFAEVLK